MKGVINILKPEGMTSHDVVSFLRKKLNIKRIGHAGTLDPMATGVLPICIGKSTRIAEYLLDLDKEYIAELTLGFQTDTQDSSGQIINTSDKIVDKNAIINSMNKFIGNIEQIPPMYSALKHKGKKLYELAREGITIERKSRSITIYNLDILQIKDNRNIVFKVKCSKGTYIRTLCNDIGLDLGTFGYMSNLKRTSAGTFKIENAYNLEYIESLTLEEIKNILIPMDDALPHIEKLAIKDKYYSKLINGVKILIEKDEYNNIELTEENIYRIYCKNKFIGIGRIIRKESKILLKMDKVLI
ncbi:MAG TPA: tRNA pseudouridine(55) synthase TruB [Tissierellaceae bacterium]|nr:tRNA pseudouridine(55) synthase TruB [Tissierellaceae bacterium]